MKIAVVKSEIHQDLWVSEITSNINTIFQTSLMRCSPIGLLEYTDTEFIIIKDTNEYPSRVYTSLPPRAEQESLKYNKDVKILGLPFLDNTYHKHTTITEVANYVDKINWSNYHIVITINACVPDRIIQQYPHILWCYYISENEPHFTNILLGNYDIILNQNVQQTQNHPFSIGFPYTFLGPNTLENISVSKETRQGIYMEINNTQERPVRTIHPAFQYISDICKIPINIHNQNIVENLKTLSSSKYFVKLFGRQIRGNGVLEAISAGALVLINKTLVMYSDLIPDECHIETPQDAIEKINYFEKNAHAYESMIRLQKKNLEENYAVNPLNQLYQKYKEKMVRVVTI